MFSYKINKWVLGVTVALLPLTSLHAVKAEDVLGENDSHTVVDGVQARKGTIAATMKNVAALNQLATNDSLDVDNCEVQQILADQRELMPALYVIGVFDLFSLGEWLTPANGEGRVYIGVLLLQAYPQLLGEEEMSLLAEYSHMYSAPLRAEIDRLLA